ncbi:hypothetical protein CEUSTIGMA_g8491.t1 [Chlamydomonas eustigma]|uniref:Radial spoke protein 8 n=1 Tax=Chlamydomonas eustigma TaxID=1157962 RepID=A0A250XDC2_9CHLO|nr:hypothetical protein CEUSTIGMA_g8491.t1 [Chlamydomonas eustigma]|eukprot:GAX81056.1 hypothetical protein CEUSTIGMA_g8491.t1 [Chlamydomonas eustigma]
MKMQSHASRRVCSEFLKDLHPDLSPPFPKGVIKDEIAVAYGRRGIIKLIEVLALEDMDLRDEDRAHALRVLIGLLTTQEMKNDAVAQGACVPLTALIRRTRDPEVLKLSCDALGSLSQVQLGREAIIASDGVPALTEALQTSPEAAAGAFRLFTMSTQGVSLLGPSLDPVVQALVILMDRPKDDGVSLTACENAVTALASLSTADLGIIACLTYGVPKCVVRLIDRGLTGDHRSEKDLMLCMEQCALCLEQVSHHPYGKTAVREADGVRALGSLLGLARFNLAVQKKTTAALMAVSVEKEAKQQVVLFAGQHLVRLLKSDNAVLVANARAALISASESLEARKLLSHSLDETQQVQMLYKGPVPPTPPDFRYLVSLPVLKQ